MTDWTLTFAARNFSSASDGPNDRVAGSGLMARNFSSASDGPNDRVAGSGLMARN